jgi:hypothetical protein
MRGFVVHAISSIVGEGLSLLWGTPLSGIAG